MYMLTLGWCTCSLQCVKYMHMHVPIHAEVQKMFLPSSITLCLLSGMGFLIEPKAHSFGKAGWPANSK